MSAALQLVVPSIICTGVRVDKIPSAHGKPRHNALTISPKRIDG